LLNEYLKISGKTLEEALVLKILVIGLIDLAIYLVGCFVAKEKLVRSFFKRA